MANNITALKPEIWSASMQIPLTKSLVALEVASTELAKELTVGDKIWKGYSSTLSAETYTPGTALTAQDFQLSADSIDITTKQAVPFYIDDTELMQAKPKYTAEIAEDAAYQLRDAIDTAVLADVSAGILFGDGTATAGEAFATGTTATVSAIAATTANIIKVFSMARAALRTGNVKEMGDWIGVVSPDTAQLIEERALISGFNMADSILRNGYAGDFLGFKIYVSNNLTGNYAYIGKKGAIDLVMLAAPQMEIKQVSDKLGRNFIAWTVYGKATFTRNASRFLNVWIT